MLNLYNKVNSYTILTLLAVVSIALAFFVNRSITDISDALAAEVVQQQSDVSILLHEYDNLVIAVETERLKDSNPDNLKPALIRVEDRLEAMRFNYSFERLDGAATAHAFVKPVLEDVRQWMMTGIPGVESSPQQIVSLVSQRLRVRHDALGDVALDADVVARELISTQASYLTRFGKSLVFLLGLFALLAMGIVYLLTRQRNLQYQIAQDQRLHVQRIKDFADTGADWYWEMDDDLRLRWLTGRTLSETAGNNTDTGNAETTASMPEFTHRLNTDDWPLQYLKQQQEFSDFETQWIANDGAIKTVSLSGKPLFDSRGLFEGYRGTGRDITAQKQIEVELQAANEGLINAESRGRKLAEQALRDSEMFLRTSLNALPQKLAIVNSDGIILEANTAWQDYAGSDNKRVLDGTCRAPEAGGLGWKFEDVFLHRGDTQRAAFADVSVMLRYVLNGHMTTLRAEVRIPAAEKSTAEVSDADVSQPIDSDSPIAGEDSSTWLAIAASPFQSNGQRYCILAMEEVTERKQLEEQDRQLRAELAHVSRLTTVGELATGLAHELNQPLTAISHNCDALLSGIKDNPAFDQGDVEAINDIHTEADRAGAIIKGLRKMVRKETGHTTATDINKLVTETVRLNVADASRHGIRVRLDLADDLPRPDIDAVQIQQVLLNLVRNALDAIRSGNPPTREMIISTVQLDSTQIRVTVQDTAGGLSEEDKPRLFNPFSTTKKDGMGMGLSISRSILESHRGQLWVDFSDPNMTTFHFTLLIAAKTAARRRF